MVIIIALVIGIICSSLLVVAYFYRLEYQKKIRYDALQNNLGSAISILVAGDDTSYSTLNTISLFNNGADSVSTHRIFWGVFDVGVAKAFIQQDSFYKVFTIANTVDSTKWAALYLSDDGRPVSVSGKTMIRGNAFIPKSGIRQAYMDNYGYTGSQRLIIGTVHASQKSLPILQTGRLEQFEQLINQVHSSDSTLLKNDSVQNSFLNPTRVVEINHKVITLKNISLTGNVMIFSDTSLTIDSSAVLNNVLVFAKSITVKSGFHGTCQLFASDTIGVGPRCRFDYPSCLGILRFKPTPTLSSEEKISISTYSTFSGLIFTYEKEANNLQPLIDIGSSVKIIGQVYSQGILELKNYAQIDGSVFTSKFLYQSAFTRYENYLTNATIDARSLSPYYLSSDLVPVVKQKKRILQWLEAN